MSQHQKEYVPLADVLRRDRSPEREKESKEGSLQKHPIPKRTLAKSSQ